MPQQPVSAAKPTSADDWTALGMAASERGDREHAITCFEQALQLATDSPTAQCNLGLALHQARQFERAHRVLTQVVSHTPQHAQGWFLLGNVCMSQQTWAEARDAYTQALRFSGPDAALLRNRSVAHLQCHDLDTARADCHASLQQSPHLAPTWQNLGLIERERGALAESLAAYDRALALDPDSADAHADRAWTYLLQGDYALGWQEYMWRWKKPMFALPRALLESPVWQGQPLAGRSILIHCEQGLGDTLQFCRFAHGVAALGARVALAVQPPLAGLLSANFSDPITVFAADTPLPRCDFRCGLLDLPWLLAATSEPFVGVQGYLHANPGTRSSWVPLDDAPAALHVGLVWRGSPRHPNDHRRSMALADWLACLPVGPHYVALQADLTDGERAALSTRVDMHLPELQISDWNATTALVSALDVVVTVDTSMAHLAGALGKPTWVLLPYAPDWRWQLQRADSPWYSGVRLLRQSAPGQWAQPLQAMADALAAWQASTEKARATQR